MRFSFLSVLFYLLLISCGSQERSIEELNLVQKGDLLKYYYDGTPFTGLVIDQTKPTEKITYTVEEVKLNGSTKYFNQAQQLTLHQNYTSGKLSGLVTFFSQIGQSFMIINISMERKAVPKSCTILLKKLKVFFTIKREV